MKILGHPFHIMLIHFPSALLPMDVVCAFLSWYYHSTSFAAASLYAMAGGVLVGCLAIVTGTLDLIKVSYTRQELLKKVLIHGGINTLVISAYAVFTILAMKHYPEISLGTPGVIAFKAALVSFMIVGNYIGGSLVLKDRVGAEEPKN